ncbi:glycosyltransferase [Fortiea sp. LEGE XX443]|uniref:glycosyltransferase n=1 Tax=Fortiea sp. LEGE XX443 TaxID=1828611 RepID=UPI001881F2AD|nr:glycosyltransferase [Fortiea sp. LEGE XX443]MBE9008229.1 glycosyltransferase [Fortiea sp. LEGE XX443]
MNRLCIYYIREPESDRWLPGDRYLRPLIRRLVRGAPRPGGVDKVFINLCLGLEKLGIQYEVNVPFKQLKDGDRVGILGRGRNCLKGYNKSNPIVAGIGLMTHPSEWPTLCEEYPVVRYLQHSDWANEVYKPYFGDRCSIWPVGIDTDFWKNAPDKNRPVDFLIYNKIRWNYEQYEINLLEPIRQRLKQEGLTFGELRYGYYNPQDYRDALNNCRAMIFLCEHESQGLAYQECLATGVPILAWDQGECLDPNRFSWGMPHITATSVPYWDECCGVKFKDISEFSSKLDEFIEKLEYHNFAPREYILKNLTLESCAKKYLRILNEVYENLV